MKKLKILTLALLCALIAPVFAGCFGGSDPKLELHTSPAVYYAVGDQINLDNAKLKYGEDYVAITNDMVSSFSTKTAGSKQMIITHDGKTVMVDYYVFENVQNHVWYQTQTLHSDGSTQHWYVQFNKTTKTFVLYASDYEEPEYNPEDLESNFHHSYTQTVDVNGTKITSIKTEASVNGMSIIEITNITANSFTLDCKTYFDEVLDPGASFTLSFTKM